jgi:hypothetical protein
MSDELLSHFTNNPSVLLVYIRITQDTSGLSKIQNSSDRHLIKTCDAQRMALSHWSIDIRSAAQRHYNR